MRENLYRLALAILLAMVFIIVMAEVVRGQEISIDVAPKMVLVNPYKSVTFRVLIRIPENPDNRRYSYSATCGSEVKMSQSDVDQKVYTKFEELVVLEDCVFLTCVHRVVSGKPKTYCDKQVVKTGG